MGWLYSQALASAPGPIKAQVDAKKEFDSYVREQAQSGSAADELHKLAELKDKGALSAEEFDQAKAKLLG